MQKIKIDFQKAFSKGKKPHSSLFKRWAVAVVDYLEQSPDYQHLLQQRPMIEFSVRFVEEEESEKLNAHYHHENKPTNVLAFPFQDVAVLDLTHQYLLGDLVLCVRRIEKEAETYGYTRTGKTHEYWAHIFIHGLLHLFQFAHDCPESQEKMEAVEVAVLAKLKYPNPYT